MTAERARELKSLFTDPAVLAVAGPLIDELAGIEDRITELRGEPFIRFHPKDRSIQKATPAGRLYKDLVSKQTDIVRILLMQLRRDGEMEEESPLREYLRRLEGGP
jgi:hypothetical protein